MSMKRRDLISKPEEMGCILVWRVCLHGERELFLNELDKVK
jgi:hypothetical protein